MLRKSHLQASRISCERQLHGTPVLFNHIIFPHKVSPFAHHIAAALVLVFLRPPSQSSRILNPTTCQYQRQRQRQPDLIFICPHCHKPISSSTFMRLFVFPILALVSPCAMLPLASSFPLTPPPWPILRCFFFFFVCRLPSVPSMHTLWSTEYSYTLLLPRPQASSFSC